jgi:transposase InsO family protein
VSTSACRKTYDHRLRDITCEEGDPMLFRDLGVPRSTAASWIRRGQRPVVSTQVLALDQLELQAEVLALERRIKFLHAIIRLAFLLVRLSGFRLDTRHVPDGATKRSILDAIAHATKAIPLAVALRVLRLSAARYHDWRKRPPDCSLDDHSSYPHTSPTQVTAREVSDMRDMVVSQDYRHMSIFSLALRAQRIGKIFLSPSTWGRLIRERGWLRPRHRVYPAKPKEGIRATKPNEFWHIDVTVIKLLDGTRTYLHAVIDNFSRRILSWKLVLHLEPQTTCQVLVEAAKNLPKNGDGATVIADSGVENVNDEVDDLLGLGQLHRILAQVEVSYSNSMIEALWRSMKHGWLFLHHLDTFAALEKLIAFYVEQHNSVVPHSAFAGQTPDEMYFGRGDQVPVDLATGRARAREARMKSNRELSCEACRSAIRETPSALVSSAIPGVLQLHDEMSATS